MTTLTPYQQAVLTELGIVQWQLRDKQAPGPVADSAHSIAAVPAADPAPRANAQSAIARLKQAMQDSTTTVQSPPEPVQASEQAPVPAQHAESTPRVAPVWVADNEPMLSDMQLALNWSDGQQSLSWQVADKLELEDGVLYCPAPAALAANASLKRQLWLLLQRC